MSASPRPEASAAPADAEPAIQLDPEVGVATDTDDDGSTDTSSLLESTASLSSSIRDYRVIKGRTYQESSTTEQWEPNDAKQTEMFDVTHHYTLLLMQDKLFGSPPPPADNADVRILDVGTGTGIWAMDVADEYPMAQVIGTDISPVQPGWVPPNCSFQIDDAQLDWTFQPDHFDRIHARNLYGSIDSWQRMYDQAFTHLKPGGWFENMEFDITSRSENPAVEGDEKHVFKKWSPLFWEAGDITGRTFRVAQEDGSGEEIMMMKCMKKAGFKDIVHKKWKVPVGGWPKDPELKQVGHYAGFFIDQSLDGWALKPIGEIMGWTFEEITVLVMEMRRALRDPKTMSYFNFHLVYGRKPEVGETPEPEPLPVPPPAPAPAAASSPAPATETAPASTEETAAK